jgi:tetratricopeptide (TPR) repeat protein
MKQKSILLLFALFLFITFCDKHTENRRKIRLAKNQSLSALSDNRDDVSVIQLDAMEEKHVVILPFLNFTGEEEMGWLSKGIADMLIRDLSQSPHVKVTDLQRVSDLYINHDLEADDVVDTETLKKFGAETQSEAVLKGSFQNRNDSLIIDVDVYNVQAGFFVDKAVVTGYQLENIFNMVDELSSRLKSALKVSFEKSIHSDFAIAEISTQSLPAYKSYTQGVELAYQAYWNDALGKFEHAIALDSTFAMAHFWASVMSSRLDRNDAATAYIDNAMHFSGNVTPGERMKIEWLHLINSGKRHEGFKLLKSIVEHFPDDKEYRFHLANNYFFYRDWERANEQLQVALKLDRDYIQACILKSEVMRVQGDHDGAILCLKNYITRNPGAAAAYHELARTYEERGEYDFALSYYKKATSIKEDFYISYLNMAKLYSSLGEYQHATDNYLTALSIVPTRELKARVFTGLAHISKAQGKFNQAIEQIKFASEYQESIVNRSDYLVMLASFYFKKDAIDSSLALTRRALEIQPKNLLALELLGRIQAHIGNVDGAAKIAGTIDSIISELQFEQLRNIQYRLLGKIAEARGDYELGTHYFEKILSDNRNAFSVYKDLGGIYLKKNEPERAIHSYKKYIEKNPFDAPAIYELALAYSANGDTERANQYMYQFLDLWKDADTDIPEMKHVMQHVQHLENE